MICDAHVHMGYFRRKGRRLPFYYSPRRILGVLDRCGVDEFIVSSTCAQIAELGVDDIMREYREMKRLAGKRAHLFFWLSRHLFEQDPELRWMDCGLFEGIKFHELEARWMEFHRDDLYRIIEKVSRRGFCVQFHSGEFGFHRPGALKEIALAFPQVHFDFAHCAPTSEMSEVIAECSNVWTDTAMLSAMQIAETKAVDLKGRLMFGSDIPVWQAFEDIGLTERYREHLANFERLYDAESSASAFLKFLNINKGGKNERWL